MSWHLIVRDQSAANCFLNNIYSTPERRNVAESVANGSTLAYLLFFDRRLSRESRSCDSSSQFAL